MVAPPEQDTIILRYFPIYLAALWTLISYAVSWIGGWSVLAKQFRTDENFADRMCRWFYATMRWGTHYNGALKAGANVVGLYIAPVLLFRIAHPPLFIPWSEIKVGPSRWFDFYLGITLTLGREEQIPFRISQRVARKLRSEAGAGWPDPQNLLQL
jgi:hypothetical protein